MTPAALTKMGGDPRSQHLRSAVRLRSTSSGNRTPLDARSSNT